jgi:hypothetical protein
MLAPIMMVETVETVHGVNKVSLEGMVPVENMGHILIQMEQKSVQSKIPQNQTR